MKGEDQKMPPWRGTTAAFTRMRQPEGTGRRMVRKGGGRALDPDPASLPMSDIWKPRAPVSRFPKLQMRNEGVRRGGGRAAFGMDRVRPAALLVAP